MQPKNPLQNTTTTTKHSQKSIAFNELCIELQYAFVAASDELIALNYLGLKRASHTNKQSWIGYHVPPLIFEQSQLLLRPSTYKEIIEERCALQLCGLPICGNKLPSIPNANKKYYRLNLNKKEIYQEIDSLFCCQKCYQKSMQFEFNLEDVAIQFKSHSMDKIKQALQFIFSWYKGKIKINIPTVNNNNNNNTNELNQMVQNLKIIEKNVAFNVHQINEQKQTQTSAKQKWTRPGHNKNKNKHINKIRMEVDDEKVEKRNNNEINLTKMEELFRIQKQEKLRLQKENEKEKQSVHMNNNNNNNNNENWRKDKNEKGREIKVNKVLNQDMLDKIENDKLRILQQERHTKLYNSMSDRAQIMGYYISWITDATTFFVMNNKNGYMNWKNKSMNKYNEMYGDLLLKQRQELLIGNIMKYVIGLLKKFKVNVSLTSMICNDIHLLIDTLDVVQAIPTFKPQTWCFIAFVFLKLISHRINALNNHVFHKKDLVTNVLKTIGFGHEYVTTLEGIVVLD